MADVVYDVTDHPLLSAKAKALVVKDEVAFAEQVAHAVELLGIAGTTYTGTALTKVRRALALQINWQLILPMEVFYKKQEGSAASKQTTTYRDGISLVFPMAATLIGEVQESGGWADCKSVRRSFA